MVAGWNWDETAISGLIGYNDLGLVNGATVTSGVSAGANAYYVAGGVGWNSMRAAIFLALTVVAHRICR